MTDRQTELAELTRPIIGIENRSALEAFDIMVDRIRGSFRARSFAPQEPDDALRLLVEESLYHLRLDARAKDYHERALAVLEGKTLASKGRCHCGFWPCPAHQLDDISEHPAVAQEPVADDDAEWPSDAIFERGAQVKKKGRASWRGSIVGWYRTDLTELGFAVESAFEPGSVQIYPQSALEPWEAPETDYCKQEGEG